MAPGVDRPRLPGWNPARSARRDGRAGSLRRGAQTRQETPEPDWPIVAWGPEGTFMERKLAAILPPTSPATAG